MIRFNPFSLRIVMVTILRSEIVETALRVHSNLSSEGRPEIDIGLIKRSPVLFPSKHGVCFWLENRVLMTLVPRISSKMTLLSASSEGQAVKRGKVGISDQSKLSFFAKRRILHCDRNADDSTYLPRTCTRHFLLQMLVTEVKPVVDSAHVNAGWFRDQREVSTDLWIQKHVDWLIGGIVPFV